MRRTVDGIRDCVNEFSKVVLWGQMRTPPDCVQVLCTVQIGYLCYLFPRLPRDRTNTQILESEKAQAHSVTANGTKELRVKLFLPYAALVGYFATATATGMELT